MKATQHTFLNKIARLWILITIFIGIFYAGRLVYEQLWRFEAAKVALPIQDCDLRQGACKTTLPGGEPISLKISPTNMPVLTTIMLEVKVPYDMHVSAMNISFKGKEMDMGEFQYALQSKRTGVYAAQTVLPTCIHNEMVWQAILTIQTKKKHYVVPFTLINEKPRPPSALT